MSKDKHTAVEWFTSADVGNAVAMLNLVFCYENDKVYVIASMSHDLFFLLKLYLHDISRLGCRRTWKMLLNGTPQHPMRAMEITCLKMAYVTKMETVQTRIFKIWHKVDHCAMAFTVSMIVT